jgi:hypothetical protein
MTREHTIQNVQVYRTEQSEDTVDVQRFLHITSFYYRIKVKLIVNFK